ncbi:MAG: permease-like cell division protein FtsX [Patescibacteria group bacterium]|nr:permease-like cell division protein FtsX [Patescibacteria group bacterium]
MRVIKTTWKHIRRSPYQAIAAILTLFITLLLTGIFSLATASSVLILQYFESKPQLIVFFKDRAGKKEADSLRTTLEATGKIANIKYVSKEDALMLYREQNKNDPLLLEMVTADILPASLEITTTKPEFLAEIEPIIKKAEGIEEIIFQRDIVESLLKWTRGVRMFLGGLVALLALDTILVIMVVTSMKIALKKEEIEILRLVGASRWYIRSPFIIEGGLYGFISACIAWIVIIGGILWYREALLSFFQSIPIFDAIFANPGNSLFIALAGGIFSILACSGFLLGCLGSFFAVNRFLKL